MKGLYLVQKFCIVDGEERLQNLEIIVKTTLCGKANEVLIVHTAIAESIHFANQFGT